MSANGRGDRTAPATASLPDSIRVIITNPRGYATRYAVDAFGAPTRIEEPLGRTTIIDRDPLSRVTRVVAPSGHTIGNSWSGPDLTRSYDSTAHEATTIGHEPTYHEVTSASNGVTTDSYYWSGGKLDSTDAGIAGVTHRSRFTYESNAGRVTGRLLSSTDPAGHVTSYAYFSTGSQNLQQVTVAGRATVLGYDAIGRTTTVQDPRGLVASRVYDALNRDSLTVGFAHDTTRVGYDALFNTSVRNAAGQVYTRYPNALGWDTLEVSPSGRAQQMEYDVNGNITRYTTSRNRPVTVTYDALDGMTTQTADGATTTFTADPLDRFITTANSESIDTTRFDVAGRLEKEIAIRGAQRFERTSSYDAHGNRSALAVSPWGTSITYHYDALMRLDTLQDVSGRSTVFGYDQDFLPTRTVLPTSPALEVSRTFPATHITSGISYSNATIQAQLGAGYAENTQGLIERKIRSSSASEELGRRYSYDAQNRLTGFADYDMTNPTYVCDPGTFYIMDPVTGRPCREDGSTTTSDSSAYGYDILGNRSDSGAVILPGNRLVRFRGDTMVYDVDGNLVKRWTLLGGRTDSLIWNALGQLVSVIHNGATTTFGYDGMGRRVRKTSNGAATGYLHDGDNLLAELDATGARVAEYTYGLGVDQPLSVRRWTGGVAQTYYFASEEPGSVAGLIDTVGGLAARYTYSPFGTLVDSAGAVPNSLRFAAREYDGETGLYYNRARYYDPTVGRFISADPIGLAGGVNQYAYAGNDPVNGRDPMGLDSCGNCGGWEWPFSWETLIQMLTGGGRGGTGDGKSGGGGGGGNAAPNTPAKPPLVCRALPSGRTTGVMGALGGVGGLEGGGEIVFNYNSGQVSAFGFTGGHVGWNGGASATVFSGMVYGLNNSNANYSEGFGAVGGGVGLGGFLAFSNGGSRGLMNGGPGALAPNGQVGVVGLTLSANLTDGFSAGASATDYSNPRQLGKLAGFGTLDMLFFAARQLLCK